MNNFRKYLDMVEIGCKDKIIYLHAGYPKAIDGPNRLPSSRFLIYVGSAVNEQTGKTGMRGASRRIISKGSGHAVSQCFLPLSGFR